MYGLYGPLGAGLEPIELVKCSPLMHSQFQRFMHRLMVQSGISVELLPAFISGRPMAKVPTQIPARRIALYSDAAKEGTANPGLGGWTLGYTWTVPLTELHLQLDIPILEAIAAVVNVIFAWEVIGGTDHLPEGFCFESHVDAQATAHVLIKGKARSPMMQFVHTLALEQQAFVEMLPFLLVYHCFGLANVASDAASRGYKHILRMVANALGVKLIHRPAPDVALNMLDLSVEHASKMKHEFCWGSKGIRFGDANHPGPVYFEPMQSEVRLDEHNSSAETPSCRSSTGR